MFTTRVGFIEEKRWAPRPTKDLPESGEWMMHCMFRLRSQEFKKQTNRRGKNKNSPRLSNTENTLVAARAAVAGGR